MCFAPYVSLSTFVIEFLLAAFFLLKNPRDNLNRMIALISLLLGVYQLNEFLICVTGLGLFTKLAMITTAILPGLAITYALIISRKKLKAYWHALIYAPAVFFILMFILSNHLANPTICNSVFVQYSGGGLLAAFFGSYYLIYLMVSAIIFYFAASNAKSKYEERLARLGMLGMFIFTIPTFVFLLFLPALKIQFASVLCEFALLLAIELVFVLWYKDKHRLKY
jgi:hypothetical protein